MPVRRHTERETALLSRTDKACHGHVDRIFGELDVVDRTEAALWPCSGDWYG